MTEALIFYRTPTSRIVDTADAHNLPAAQRLNFILPDNVWESVEETFRINNKKFPIVTSKGGVKKIGVVPVGLKMGSRKVRGYFKGSVAASVAKLRAFRKLQQIDSYHEFGVFGMVFSPQAPDLDIEGDPDNTFGWTYDEYTLKNLSSLSNKVYDFSVELSFGGTLP